MTLWLLIVPTLCYLLSGFLFSLKGDYAGAVTFGAYGVANLGLIWKFIFP